jgi:GYF domain 2
MSADSMTTGWHYAKQGALPGQQTGPLTWEELWALAQSGALAPADMVWHQTLPGWVPAADVSGLLPSPAVAAPAACPALVYGQAAQASWPQGAQPGRRRSWLYWVIPLCLVALAALVLGLVLGLRDGDDRDGGSTASDRTTTTEGPAATTTTEAAPAWTRLDPAGAAPTARLPISPTRGHTTPPPIPGPTSPPPASYRRDATAIPWSTTQTPAR